MIKISLIINRNNDSIIRFDVDNDNRLIMLEPSVKESIIIDSVSNEFDGICDDDGRLHFLIQTLDGSLVYIKFDGIDWKKYIVFKSKSKIARITNINLTEDKGILCGFYIIEHKDKIMLIKHIFSSSNLYSTPEVIELLDIRKEYSICINKNSMTEVYCRNSNGDYIKKILDRSFCVKTSQLLNFEKSVFSFCCVNNGYEIITAYTTIQKGYTALIVTTAAGGEKIITFAVAKNCYLSLAAMGDFIIIRWNESNNLMECISKNAGRTFSKPKILGRKSERHKYREKELKPGLYFSSALSCLKEDFNPFKKITELKYDNNKSERLDEMTPIIRKREDNDCFRDMDYKLFSEKISAIENEVSKIGKDTAKICIFLDELVKFKEENIKKDFKISEKKDTIHASATNNIGEENSENIKLFESMNIDDVLPNHSTNIQQGSE
ncbi:MAG: hypothetical protein II998_12325 [Clostridia bacterium]|nr:hypothetical protein [Clostridia bacterium]